ncbi:hypothetical protein ACSTII_00025, partial [Vibrio parahaemolyticus]
EKYGEVKYFDVEGNEIKAPVEKKVDASVTANSIIQKCLEATGVAAMANIKDVEMTGTASVMGKTLGFTQK